MIVESILLVDDEEDIRDVLGIYLADLGYTVFTAENGEEGLSLFQREKPPVVFTDIKMPGMDGIELLRKIKALRPDTEVIMITGHGDMELAIKSLKYDATEFITKPIDDDALEIALKRARERLHLKARVKEYTENLEQLVEEKTRQLVRAERMAAVGQTVAGVAHAIKNVTGGLGGGIFVLEKGMELNNSRYLSQGWEMIKGNVGKVKTLALDLIKYAKEKEPDYKLWDPNEPAREVHKLMLPRAEEYGVILELSLDSSITHVKIDPEEIHRCLLDLVTNAIDACADVRSVNRPGKVMLESGKTDGWAVEYRITDNGCGMDDETRDKIFQYFFTTKGSKGTGLGLMITRKIIDNHGGEIKIKTCEGKGTVAIIRLPQRRENSSLNP